MRVGDVVSLRLRTPDGPAEVVGTLVEASATALSVRHRDGTVERIPATAVEAFRVVPPAPSRSVGVRELAAITARGWRAPAEATLGDWLLRAADGFTRRANSALATGSGVPDLGARVDEVTRWYDAQGLPARLQVAAGDEPAGLAAVLAPRGWTVSTPTQVLTAEAAHVLRGLAGEPAATGEVDPAEVPVRVEATPSGGWFDTYRADAHPLPAVARTIVTGHPHVAFVEARTGSDVVAIARVCVDDRWAGLSCVEVSPEHRRRGLARAVTAAALQWAVAGGARRCYLQVAADNAPAVALWQRLGFTHHHDYVYVTAPVGPAAGT